MKGGINFELKADIIIIYAPVDTPKHLINIFEILPDGTNKTTLEERKGQATQGNSTWRTGMAGLLARV